MYIIDFFKNLFKKNNIGTIIWMVMNLILICSIAAGFIGSAIPSVGGLILGIFVGIVFYVASIAIALCPLGEKIIRWQTGCHKIKDADIDARIRPIFNEVYRRAKALNPELPDDIELFMSNDEEPNAFATGRKTVCFTKGLLTMSDDDIMGILGHEFGHLAHKDTDTLLVILVGNTILTVFFTITRVFINISARITNFFIALFSDSWFPVFLGWLSRIFVDFILAGLMVLWTRLGVVICMTSSRANEYLADHYAFELGFGLHLANALNRLDSGSKPRGVWAALSSSHPKTSDRIQKLVDAIKGIPAGK